MKFLATLKGMTTNFFSPLSFVAVLDPGSGMAKNQDPGSGTPPQVHNVESHNLLEI